ncbi:MAG: ribonuclease HII [Actinomycetota bacterium]
MRTDAAGTMEQRLHAAGFERVAGTDEVGRGALAGPLFAAAVVLPPEVRIEGLRDSKMCTPLQREHLAEKIREVALAVSVVRIQHHRIDRDGLNPCNRQALRRAVNTLGIEPDYVIIDCFRLRRFSYPALAVKKGDAVSRNVAAASIVAKVQRDRAMRRYHRKHPDYGFAMNKGYGTREHWAALQRFGPCEIHRRSFFGVLGFPGEDGVLIPHGARDLEVDPDGPEEEEWR